MIKEDILACEMNSGQEHNQLHLVMYFSLFLFPILLSIMSPKYKLEVSFFLLLLCFCFYSVLVRVILL